MSRCIIIAPLYAGEDAEWLHKGEGDFLICADGGYDAAVRCGLIDAVGGLGDALEALNGLVERSGEEAR